jgi:hypothetical protein
MHRSKDTGCLWEIHAGRRSTFSTKLGDEELRTRAALLAELLINPTCKRDSSRATIARR